MKKKTRLMVAKALVLNSGLTFIFLVLFLYMAFAHSNFYLLVPLMIVSGSNITLSAILLRAQANDNISAS